MKCHGRRPQLGAAVVEFAIVATLFFGLLVGIVEMGRVLFTWNSAVEATRRGARMAVVTAPGDAATIRDEVRRTMPDLADDQIFITYLPAGCTLTTCDYVSVSVGGYSVTPLVVPIGPLALPPFSTTLPRESLGAG